MGWTMVQKVVALASEERCWVCNHTCLPLTVMGTVAFNRGCEFSV